VPIKTPRPYMRPAAKLRPSRGATGSNSWTWGAPCRRTHGRAPPGRRQYFHIYLDVERTKPPRPRLHRISRRPSSAMRRRVNGPSMHARPLSTFGPQRDIGADAGLTDNCERSDADRDEAGASPRATARRARHADPIASPELKKEPLPTSFGQNNADVAKDRDLDGAQSAPVLSKRRGNFMKCRTQARALGLAVAGWRRPITVTSQAPSRKPSISRKTKSAGRLAAEGGPRAAAESSLA
jgi:hypothetical protein